MLVESKDFEPQDLSTHLVKTVVYHTTARKKLFKMADNGADSVSNALLLCLTQRKLSNIQNIDPPSV